jgi:hypothetical protein
MRAFYPWMDDLFGTKRTWLLSGFALLLFGAETIVLPIPAHASCQYLGTNYSVQYDCTQNQPWLPYGTQGNPPVGSNPTPICAQPMHQHDMACAG